ncbi:MAG: MBL fold metallo-hydrolase [Actinobacteria bacterium]|nr:MBL fold metallo-hydrolase [Actinomycetota bacterium]
MVEGIEWLGHDSFRITGSRVVYIDPWKLAPGAPQADVILVTHDHFDHFSAPDIAAISGPRTVVVGPASVTSQLAGATTVTVRPGDTVEAGGVPVTVVPAYNTNKFRAPGQVFHEKGDQNVGYVFDLDGRRIYHAGDTDAIAEMDGLDVDVALLPVSGTYVMTAEEAAEACETIDARVVVPMHYGEVAGSVDDAERLLRICPYPVKILQKSR